jgi:hypothetical protein
MFYLASTRFNHSTWNENTKYRREYLHKGAIYGVSIKINEKYPLKSIMFVIEMNNETNNICGIGIIRNSLLLNKKYTIYEENNYNRFIYAGDFWLSREEIQEHDSLLVDVLENVLFKGKGHLKRQSGISIISSKSFLNWKYDEKEIKESIKNLFILKFKTEHL